MWFFVCFVLGFGFFLGGGLLFGFLVFVVVVFLVFFLCVCVCVCVCALCFV